MGKCLAGDSSVGNCPRGCHGKMLGADGHHALWDPSAREGACTTAAGPTRAAQPFTKRHCRTSEQTLPAISLQCPFLNGEGKLVKDPSSIFSKQATKSEFGGERQSVNN